MPTFDEKMAAAGIPQLVYAEWKAKLQRELENLRKRRQQADENIVEQQTIKAECTAEIRKLREILDGVTE
jgi:hypothetical protein